MINIYIYIKLSHDHDERLIAMFCFLREGNDQVKAMNKSWATCLRSSICPFLSTPNFLSLPIFPARSLALSRSDLYHHPDLSIQQFLFLPVKIPIRSDTLRQRKMILACRHPFHLSNKCTYYKKNFNTYNCILIPNLASPQICLNIIIWYTCLMNEKSDG